MSELFIDIEPLSPSRGTAVIAHGLGEHCGRYAPLARFFRERGYSVVRFDHRGHGRSPGARGALPHPRTLLDDLATVIDRARRELPGGELILLGHSMGGAIAARFVAEEVRRVDRLVLSSPALETHIRARDRVFVRVASRIAPHLPRRNGLDATKISHDPDVVAAYRGDPLVHDVVTPRLVKFILDAGKFVIARAPRWRVPTLLMWAGDDHLVRRSGSEAFAAAAPRDVVRAVPFPGAWHELFNEAEPTRSHVFATLREWLG